MYYHDVLPFLNLADALTIKPEKCSEYKNDDSIESMIYNTNYVIQKLEDLENKQQLIHKLDLLQNKYYEIINQLIKDKVSNEEKYKQVVLSLRKELQELLYDLNINAVKEEAQNKLLKQFEESLILVEKYNFFSEKEAKNTTELFVKDIFNCLKDPSFNEEEREKIKEKIYLIINEAISKLKTSLSKEETKEIEMNTYKKLTELLFITSDYAKKIKEYNETYFKK